MPPTTTKLEFAALIGIDWGDRKHDICLVPADSDEVEHLVLEHRPGAIDAWARSLARRFGGKPLAVCLECDKGPIVSALLEHDIFVLFPVNPLALSRYRKAFAVSGAKDDPTDAKLVLDLLRRHPEKLAPLCLERTEVRALRRLVEDRRALVDDRTRITNRLTHALKAYFPQVVRWFRDKETEVFSAFLERWPTLQAAQRARPETLRAFFHQHHVVRPATIDRRRQAIREEQPLTTDAAVIEPALLLVQALLPQLRAVRTAIARFDREIARRCRQLPDYELFHNLPGAGPVYSARLLAAFGERRDRFRDAAALQRYAGVAPVTKRSGKKKSVHWRFVAAKFLRQTFVEWSEQTITTSFWARAFYHRHRARGTSHQATLRALAFKWIRILYRCWVERRPYDEARYLLALQRRGSPVLASLTNEANLA